MAKKFFRIHQSLLCELSPVTRGNPFIFFSLPRVNSVFLGLYSKFFLAIFFPPAVVYLKCVAIQCFVCLSTSIS